MYMPEIHSDVRYDRAMSACMRMRQTDACMQSLQVAMHRRQ